MKEDINYINEILNKCIEAVNISSSGIDIKPYEVDKALALFPKTMMEITRDYHKERLSYQKLLDEFKIWYNEKFVIIKAELEEKKVTKSTKIAVSEYEAELISHYKEQYSEWKRKLRLAEYKKACMKDIADNFQINYGVLKTISQNMISERRSLSWERLSNE